MTREQRTDLVVSVVALAAWGASWYLGLGPLVLAALPVTP